jgi:hypothetical protein
MTDRLTTYEGGYVTVGGGFLGYTDVYTLTLALGKNYLSCGVVEYEVEEHPIESGSFVKIKLYDETGVDSYKFFKSEHVIQMSLAFKERISLTTVSV